MPLPRLRPLLAATAAASALALSLTACSTGPAGAGSDPAAGTEQSADAGDFPVTIEHKFGSTTIEDKPERVATVSWVNADVAIALGVVPVGMPINDWGGNEHGSTPWKDAALEDLGAGYGTEDYPQQYSETDGINFTAIAKTSPDVILAAYSGLTKADYDKLSKIAPVVAYPKQAYGTPWQKSTTMIGKALGESDEAKALVDDVEHQIDTQAAKYPQLKGKTFISGTLDPNSGNGISLYTAEDNRPRFLSSLGMKLAPVVTEAAQGNDEFYVAWSNERANELKSDIFVTWAAGAKATEAIVNDPLLSQIPAIEDGALVTNSDNTLTLSISASSPLSLPWALDQYLPKLAEAATAAEQATADQ